MKPIKEDQSLERELSILLEIIQYYLSEHEAVSARTLSKISTLSLSPTTIRNLMEDLSHEGYLTSEGVSRGRIPTQKAFTVYVSSLYKFASSPQERPAEIPVEEEESQPDLEHILQSVATFLSEKTGFPVMVSLPEQDNYPLAWVRLTTAPGNKLLVGIQSMLGDLWCKALPGGELVPESVLKEVEDHICENYRGDPLRKIRNDIMAGAPKEIMESIPSLGPAFRLLRKAFEWDTEPRWRVWGQGTLYGIAEYQDPELLVKLTRALENPNLLKMALAGGRQVEGGMVAIGTETGIPGLESSSVVGAPFGFQGFQGTIGVLGPMRMDYPFIFQLVSKVQAVLNEHVVELVRHFEAECEC